MFITLFFGIAIIHEHFKPMNRGAPFSFLGKYRSCNLTIADIVGSISPNLIRFPILSDYHATPILSPFFHMFSHHPTRVDLGPFAYRNWPSLTYQSMWHLGDQLQDLPGSWSPSAVLRAPGSFWSTNWHRRSSGSLVRRSSPLKMAERCGSLLGKSMNIDDSVHLNKIKQYCLDDFRILLEVLGSENQTQSCVMTIMIRKRNTS